MVTDATSDQPGAERVGQMISGRYLIRALLGEGGMGAVYLAEHTLMRKRFALKMLHPQMAENPEVVARFRREAEAAAQIEHPNVVAASDFGQTDDGAFFLVLEYVDGTSLRDALGDGAFTASRALRVARQMALALERAHGAGVVHRDLKPENVMLVNRDGDPDFVKVLDFGVARFDPGAKRGDGQQPLTRVGSVIGTPEYMAPEQALGERVVPASDLYAVGVILYELLAGVHPFEGDTMAMMSKHMIAPVPPIAERGGPQVSVSPAVEAIVRRLLEKEASARYADARALVVAIEDVAAAGGLDVGATPTSDRMRVAMSRQSSAAIVPVAAAPTAEAPLPRPTNEASAGARSLSVGAKALVERLRPQVASLFTSIRTAHRNGELLAKIPPRARLAIAVAAPVLILVLVLTTILVRRSSEPPITGLTAAGTAAGTTTATGESSEPKRAPTDRLRAAAVKGSAALEALAEEFPSDPLVLRELAIAYDGDGRTSDALRTVRLAAGAEHEGHEGVPPELLRIVVRATSRPEAADEAFGLLQDSLGAEGIDALLDLSERRDVPPATRARATKLLADPAVRAHAPPATAALLDLASATTCEGKREALARVRDEADSRALASLRALKNRRGCGSRGRHDCYGCLRGDDLLDQTIEAVSQRGRN